MPRDLRLRPLAPPPPATLEARVDETGALRLAGAAADLRYQVTNLSEAPTGWRRASDGFDVTPGERVPGLVHGDRLRIQARDEHGAIHGVVEVRADLGAHAVDSRAAYIALDRVRIRPEADGVVRISSRTSLALSEPDATVRFTNPQSGAFLDVTIDRLGRLPTTDASSLGLRPGDSVTVAVSDGEGNRDLHWITGTLAVAPARRQAAAAGIVLFGDTIDPEDGKQGSLGNCPMPAGAMAVAAADPQLVRDLIHDNQDGTFTVTLTPPGQPSRDIVVDGALESRYGRANRDDAQGRPIQWFPLVEKAYAELVGGYDVMGQGLSVGDVLATLTGRVNRAMFHNEHDADAVWSALVDGYRNQKAMAAGTHPKTANVSYNGTGIYANHAYSILSVREENGQRLLTLRNPWGSSDGRILPSDGENDGVFDIPLDRFLELYQVSNIC